MKQKNIFILVFALVILVLGGAFVSRSYWQERLAWSASRDVSDAAASNVNGSTAENQDSTPDSDDISLSRVFSLVRGQTLRAPELDLQLVVTNFVFVPCEQGASCQYRQFQTEVLASLISDPTRSQRIFFAAVPAQSQGLGKYFQLLNADANAFQLLVRDLPDLKTE